MIQYLKMKVVDILFAVVLLLPGGFIRAQEIRDSLPQGDRHSPFADDGFGGGAPADRAE